MKEETISEHITELFEDTSKYIEAKTELWKLKAADKTTEVASAVVAQIVFLCIVLMVLIFLSIAFAILIGRWLGELYYGFFIIAGFYALLGLIIYASRDKIIKTPLYNLIINKIIK
ncbi:MAG: phage holin family protein [Agriterribacter sp.]